ncbi:MAG TPA: hypothetical protein VMZ31_11185 [Phycisphaerae bacterium]|nr:hypothetical protein [Phycisphaerae bacterium]
MNTLQRIIDPFPALIALAVLLGVLLSGCSSSGGNKVKSDNLWPAPGWTNEVPNAQD